MTLLLYAMASSSFSNLFSFPSRRDGWGWGRLPASMRCPLNRFEVDPLLVHLVKRRHLAELAHAPDDEVGHVVDLLVGVESSDAEANRRVRQLFADPHRPQHVARLETRAGARRAARHGDVFDGHHHRFALDEG